MSHTSMEAMPRNQEGEKGRVEVNLPQKMLLPNYEAQPGGKGRRFAFWKACCWGGLALVLLACSSANAESAEEIPGDLAATGRVEFDKSKLSPLLEATFDRKVALSWNNPELQSSSHPPKTAVELETLYETSVEGRTTMEARKAKKEGNVRKLQEEIWELASWLPARRKQKATAVASNKNPQPGYLSAEEPEEEASPGCKEGGSRKVVHCLEGVAEEVCREQLVAQDVEVVAEMPSTPYFAVCVYSSVEEALVQGLTETLSEIEDDPIRTLSVVPGSSRDATEEVRRRLQYEGQVTPYGVQQVKAPEFWETYGNRGAGVTVCVIDTGFRASHEDLRGIDADGSNNRTFVSPWFVDWSRSHGTHVTGTIAAQDNGVGVVGVAPEASIFVIRAFDSENSFTGSSLVEAMNACVDEGGADIISMSLGGPQRLSAEEWTIEKLTNDGILIIAAAGNEAERLNFPSYPASYTPAFSIAAVDENGEIADFSTHNEEIDVSAPGVGVLSTTNSNDGSYESWDGTSMAVPHVSGVAALLWSAFPTKTAAEIREAIEVSATDSGACGKDRLYGHGVVDAMAAAAYLSGEGSGAPETENCASVEVTLATDLFGTETTYKIQSKDNGDVIFRGGPYQAGVERSYTDVFEVEDGCYTISLFDSVGDGFNDPLFGQGSLRLAYNGVEQIFFDTFEGSQAVFEFGDCWVPPADIDETDEDGEVPDLDEGSAVPDSGCGPGFSKLDLVLETDLFSPFENELYLYEIEGANEQAIWSEPLGTLRVLFRYEGSTCIDLSLCNQFFFLDRAGDGLFNGGLRLIQDGVVVLRIDPFDDGTRAADGSEFWKREFGACD